MRILFHQENVMRPILIRLYWNKQTNKLATLSCKSMNNFSQEYIFFNFFFPLLQNNDVCFYAEALAILMLSRSFF